jgi:hypothetical protein
MKTFEGWFLNRVTSNLETITVKSNSEESARILILITFNSIFNFENTEYVLISVTQMSL